MRSLTAPRSTSHLFFGAIPATLLLVVGVLGLSMGHETVPPIVVGMAGSIGTWGLWNASRIDSTRSRKELLLVSAALAIGLLLILPVATVLSYIVCKSLLAEEYLSWPWFVEASLLIFGAWLFLGPIAVSVRFLWHEWRSRRI